METTEIDGKTCVVIHISEDNRIGKAAVCTGQPFEVPGQNETRPKTLCEKCRVKIREQRGI